ncbi:hypothetical protein LBMAG53_20810 [Planctomycetota bacterium]|nr:hypothetical protein LBMAG53_20810 [Planctomycetota bacterium]
MPGFGITIELGVIPQVVDPDVERFKSESSAGQVHDLHRRACGELTWRGLGIQAESTRIAFTGKDEDQLRYWFPGLGSRNGTHAQAQKKEGGWQKEYVGPAHEQSVAPDIQSQTGYGRTGTPCSIVRWRLAMGANGPMPLP